MSDHISGPRALAEPIADITDFYAFSSPEDSHRLVLVMNTLPFARVSDAFSSGLIYRFRLRPLSVATPDHSPLFQADEREWTVDCTFSSATRATGSGESRQTGICAVSTGET